jgi:ketosteroid isomerase-like protein
MESNVEIVLECFAANARGDFAGAVARMHPEVEWVEPASFLNGGRRRGRGAVERYFVESRALWAEIVAEPVAHAMGSAIVVVVHVVGRLTDGRAVDATVADVFTVEDGQITTMMAYADPADAFAAVTADG